MTTSNPAETILKVRADKWLWAARFFRTRSLAKEAIEGRRVHMDGKKIKTSKELKIGDILTIRQPAHRNKKPLLSRRYQNKELISPLLAVYMKRLKKVSSLELFLLSKENGKI